uniref:Calponin-homology (CH) domain-containing protein n=1 Tax=Capra hircus TaxID=9925 RepID=A0A452ED56_CAPHI
EWPALGSNGAERPEPTERVCRACRDRVQKKTFTKWVNKHLIKRHISDLYEDLRDGHNLISLLEVLSGDSLPREKGRMRFHKLQNVQIALDYLRHRQVRHPPGRRPRPLLRLARGCDRGPLAHR